MQHASFTQAPFIHVFHLTFTLWETLQEQLEFSILPKDTLGSGGHRLCAISCMMQGSVCVILFVSVFLCVWMCETLWIRGGHHISVVWHLEYHYILGLYISLHSVLLWHVLVLIFCNLYSPVLVHDLIAYISHHLLLSKLVPIPAPAHLNQMTNWVLWAATAWKHTDHWNQVFWSQETRKSVKRAVPRTSI